MPNAPIAEAQIIRIGAEARPVVLIEDFIARPEDLTAEATALAFAAMGRFYPGVRAPFDLQRMTDMVGPHQDLLHRLFGGARDYRADDCALSLVTTPGEQLRPLQCIPHIDTTAAHRVAVLVYLSGERFGGTGFFRHRSTGFEYVDEDRRAAYNSALDHDVETHGPPAPAYLTGDTPLYEMIASFEAKPGRALMYSVQSLHCGLIRSPEALTDDPHSGRLTLNGFVAAA
jgi:Family of unknown function (DUF6445)